MQPEVIFLIAFLSGIAGSEYSHRTKAIKRSVYAKIAVGLLSGFASGLITLIFMSQFQGYSIPLALIIGLAYGFFMAKSKAFENVR